MTGLYYGGDGLDPAALFFSELAQRIDPGPATPQGATFVGLQTPDELRQWAADTVGILIPNRRICPGHRSPLEACWTAYSAEYPRTVWKASRGFGGKTALLATLSLAEIITLGAGVTLLGGTGEQSKRVHEYMQGQETMSGKFWAHPNAPRHLLRSDPSARHTRLANAGWISALMASSASVRGPHPQRLRGDEIDEMDPEIWDAAQGQPMANEERGIREQVVGSSTHHYANATMTRELKMAKDRGWPVFEWCYKECLKEHGGWLSDVSVERKRQIMTHRQFTVEIDLQEPSPEGRAFEDDALKLLFDTARGQHAGIVGEQLIFERPVWELDPEYQVEVREPDAKLARVRDQIVRVMRASYAAGADWGKLRDHTVVFVYRTDCLPMRVVAFMRLAQMPWPLMIRKFNEIVARYRAPAAHDKTGLGTVVDDYTDEMTIGVTMVGASRANLISEYVAGVERHEIVGPRIESAYGAHLYCTNADLYETGGHPPDEVVAGALAYRAATRGGRDVMR